MNILLILDRLRGAALCTSHPAGRAIACCALAVCVLASGESLGQDSSILQARGGVATAGGLLSHGGESYRVVTAQGYSASGGSEVAAAASNTIAQAGWFGGSSCDSNCDVMGGCGSCASSFGGSPGSCNSCGGSLGYYGGGMGGSCPTCSSFWYGSIEALYMRKYGDKDFSASPDYTVGQFDLQGAPRLTIGYVPDCVNGYEFSYTGRFQWNRGAIASSADGDLRTILRAIPPVDESSLSAFQDANIQSQFQHSEYTSVEVSRTHVGWDIAKLLAGIRYIDFSDKFAIFSRSDTELGRLLSRADNRMIGFQLGMDLLYPLCTNLYTDARGRAGLFANFASMDLLVLNDGNLTAAVHDKSTDYSAVLEFGSGLKYRFCDALAIRCGWEAWWFGRLASSEDQFRRGVVSSRSVRINDDFIVVGVNIGAEFRY